MEKSRNIQRKVGWIRFGLCSEEMEVVLCDFTVNSQSGQDAFSTLVSHLGISQSLFGSAIVLTPSGTESWCFGLGWLSCKSGFS